MNHCKFYGILWDVYHLPTGGVHGISHEQPGLVNIQKTMDNHHFEWVNQRTFDWAIWPFSMSQTVNVYQRI